MKKTVRLRRRQDFAAVLAGPRVHSGRTLVGLAVERGPGISRIGVTVSRRVRGSVARNRARRRLREVARTVLLAPDSALVERGIRYDVVLIARPAAVAAAHSELEADARALLRRISRP